MRKIQVFIIIGFLLFTSCVDKQFYQEYANELDSMSGRLETSATLYVKLDSTLIKEQFQLMGNTLDSLRIFSDSTIFPEVVDYGYVRKRYKTFIREHPLTIRELKYSREQLTDLKHDVDKLNIDQAEVQKYFKQEKEAVEYLIIRMNNYRQSILRNQGKFDKLNPRVIILLDSLRAVKKIDKSN